MPEPAFLLMESFGLEGSSTIANRSYPTKSTLKDISSMYFLAAFTTCIIECKSLVTIGKIKDNINLSKNHIQNYLNVNYLRSRVSLVSMVMDLYFGGLVLLCHSHPHRFYC